MKTNDHSAVQAAHSTCFARRGANVALNDAAEAFIAERERINNEAMRLSASETGARLAQVFMDNPWLQSCTRELSSSHEYGDEGGTFLSIRASVGDVKAVPNFELPEHLADEGEFQAEYAADDLQQVLDDEAFIIYESVATTLHTAETVSLAIDRSSIDDLLRHDTVDGREAFALLLPEFAHRVNGHEESLAEAAPVPRG